MKKIFQETVFAAILLLSVTVKADVIKNPFSIEFNGEIIGNDIFCEEGRTYINIQDIAAFYDLYVAFNEDTIHLSAQVPSVEKPLAVYDAKGIQCVNRRDVYNLINGTSDECRYEYTYTTVTNEGGTHYGVSHYGIFRNSDHKLLSGIPFFTFGKNAIKTLQIAEPLPEADGEIIQNRVTDAYIPLDVYEKVVLARYLTPQYSSFAETADIIYSGNTYTLHVKNIEDKAYFWVRDLTDIFGFKVDFIDGCVQITDETMLVVNLPDGLKIHRVDGIRYLSAKNADTYFDSAGYYIGESMYELKSGQKYGGVITALEKKDGSTSAEEVFEGNSVPYMVGNFGLRMYYYDFFAKKGLV